MKWWLGLVLGAAVIVPLLAPGTVRAHAALISSEPGQNSFLKTSPAALVMTFNEPLDTRSSRAELLSATGERLAVSLPQFTNGNRTMTAMPAALAPGVHSIVWTNVSTIDGHAIRGSIPFTILNSDGSLPSGQAAGGLTGAVDPAPLLDATVVRALILLALVLVVAGCIAPLLGPRVSLAPVLGKFQALSVGSGALLLAATLLNLPGISDTYSNQDLSGILFRTQAGGYFVARAGLGLLIAVTATFMTVSPRRTAVALLAQVGVYLYCFTATSHAAAASGSGWAMSFDLVHGAAAVSWIGTVLSLAILVRMTRGQPELRPLLPRVALLASCAVYLLLATGVLGALAQVDTLEKLTTTRYGLTMFVKAGLILPLLAIAFFNARWGRMGVLGDGPAATRFVRLATLEVGVGIGVFVAAAVLTQSVVPRSIPASGSGGTQSVSAAGIDIRFQAAPNVVGLNSFRVDVAANGINVAAERVRLTFRGDGASGAPASLILDSAGAGTFLGSGAFLNLAGSWNVDIEVRQKEKDDVTVPLSLVPASPLPPTSTAKWGNPSAGLGGIETFSISIFVLGLAAMYAGVAVSNFVGDWRPRSAGVVTCVALFAGGLLPLLRPEAFESSDRPPIAVADRLDIRRLEFRKIADNRTAVVGEIANYGLNDSIIRANVGAFPATLYGGTACDSADPSAVAGMAIGLPSAGVVRLEISGCRIEFDGVLPPNTEVVMVLRSGREIHQSMEFPK